MKKNKIYTLILFLCPLLMVSCAKKEPDYEKLTSDKNGASVFLAKAVNGTQYLSVFPIKEQEKTISFNVGFGAVGYPANDILIEIDEDKRFFDSLNVAREQDGLDPYFEFPKDAYEFDESVTISKGNLYSNNIIVKYFPEKFENTKDYLLPLSIVEASGYAIDPTARTLPLVVGKLEEKPANTSNWIATASSEQLSGENTGLASAVLDGDLNTIWHAQYDPAPRAVFPHWLRFDAQEELYVTKVSLAPRQDNGNGFTKFKLEGSLDGSTWFILGDNLVFDPANRAYQSYAVEPQNVKNIRITMLEGVQDLSFLAEFIVYTY